MESRGQESLGGASGRRSFKAPPTFGFVQPPPSQGASAFSPELRPLATHHSALGERSDSGSSGGGPAAPVTEGAISSPLAAALAVASSAPSAEAAPAAGPLPPPRGPPERFSEALPLSSIPRSRTEGRALGAFSPPGRRTPHLAGGLSGADSPSPASSSASSHARLLGDMEPQSPLCIGPEAPRFGGPFGAERGGDGSTMPWPPIHERTRSPSPQPNECGSGELTPALALASADMHDGEMLPVAAAATEGTGARRRLHHLFAHPPPPPLTTPHSARFFADPRDSPVSGDGHSPSYALPPRHPHHLRGASHFLSPQPRNAVHSSRVVSSSCPATPMSDEMPIPVSSAVAVAAEVAAQPLGAPSEASAAMAAGASHGSGGSLGVRPLQCARVLHPSLQQQANEEQLHRSNSAASSLSSQASHCGFRPIEPGARSPALVASRHAEDDEGAPLSQISGGGVGESPLRLSQPPRLQRCVSELPARRCSESSAEGRARPSPLFIDDGCVPDSALVQRSPTYELRQRLCELQLQRSQSSAPVYGAEHGRASRGRQLRDRVNSPYQRPLVPRPPPISPAGHGGAHDERHVCKLPVVHSPDKYTHDLNLISAATVARLLSGEFKEHFSRVVIVDCRYRFEFAGGHVRQAVNLVLPEDLDEFFFGANADLAAGARTAVIIHCEFSQKRGPRAWRYVRSRDREVVGAQNFPNLYYPELYVLADGYKSFFTSFPADCEPSAYVPMTSREFFYQYIDADKAYRKAWKAPRS